MPNAEGGFEDVREEVDGHPMWLLMGYATRYWKRLVAGVAMALVMRLMILVPDLAVAAAIDRVVQTGGGEPGLLADIGIMPSSTVTGADARIDLLYQLGLIAAASWGVLAVTRFLSRYIFQSTAQHIQHDLRNDTYDHMQHLSMGFYDDHQTGGMMSILNSDVNRLENFFNTEIRQIVRGVVMVGVIAAVMLYEAPTLGLVVLAPLPIIGLGTWLALRYLEPKYKHIRELVATINTRLSNNLGGIGVVKSFDRYEIESGRVNEESAGYRDEKISAIKIRKGFFASLRLLIGTVFVIVLIVGGQQVIDGAMTMGTFTLFFLLLRRLRSPMQRLGKTANKYQKTKSSAERVFGVLGHEPEITTPENPVALDDVDGDVAFDDVTFSYPGHEEHVVDGVTLDVPAGSTVGFAGPSGSGKSTLLKLLPRFYEVDSGSVSVDGVDVREYDLQALRDEIGIVEQSPYLFSGTVRENIAYGDREAFRACHGGTVPEEVDHRVQEAARTAGAHEFVTDLPDGYDTQVGERGVKLSGGQRQRVSLARALLNDPEILILDEATSDVDTETEEIIQANLDDLIADRTAFVIAHRLSTIRDADEIVVMEEGEVVETGTHDDLVERDAGVYADLWERQADVDRTSPGSPLPSHD